VVGVGPKQDLLDGQGLVVGGGRQAAVLGQQQAEARAPGKATVPVAEGLVDGTPSLVGVAEKLAAGAGRPVSGGAMVGVGPTQDRL
jgi:hypothetical protein